MTSMLWSPGERRSRNSEMHRLMMRLGARLERPLTSFRELHGATVQHPEVFWTELWRHAGLVGDMGHPPLLVDADLMPGARFFPGGRLNYAENALRRRGTDDAIVFRNEAGISRRISADELRAQVRDRTLPLVHARATRLRRRAGALEVELDGAPTVRARRVIVAMAVSTEDAKKQFDNVEEFKPYLRYADAPQ